MMQWKLRKHQSSGAVNKIQYDLSNYMYSSNGANAILLQAEQVKKRKNQDVNEWSEMLGVSLAAPQTSMSKDISGSIRARNFAFVSVMNGFYLY